MESPRNLQEANNPVPDPKERLDELHDRMEQSQNLKRYLEGVCGLKGITVDVNTQGVALIAQGGIELTVAFKKDSRNIVSIHHGDVSVATENSEAHPILKLAFAFFASREKNKTNEDLYSIHCFEYDNSTCAFVSKSSDKESPRFIAWADKIFRETKKNTISEKSLERFQNLREKEDRTQDEEKEFEELRRHATRALVSMNGEEFQEEAGGYCVRLISTKRDEMNPDATEEMVIKNGHPCSRKTSLYMDVFNYESDTVQFRKCGDKILLPLDDSSFFDPYEASMEDFSRNMTTPNQIEMYEEMLPQVTKNRDDEKKYDHCLEVLGLREKAEKLKEVLGAKTILFQAHKGGERPSLRLLRTELPRTLKILGSYPPKLLHRLSINTVTLTHGTFGENRKSGEANALGEIVISFIDNGVGGSLDTILHHELFHLVDFRYLSRNHDVPLAWDEWYEPDTRRQLFGFDEDRKNPKDFLRSYGMTKQVEDTATMAEILSDPRLLIDIHEKASQNPILARKLELTKRAYYALSDGKMDTQFWSDVMSGKSIDTAYWAGRNEFDTDKAGESLRKSFHVWDEVLSRIEEDYRAVLTGNTRITHERKKQMANTLLDAINTAPHREMYLRLQKLSYKMQKKDAIEILSQLIRRETPSWLMDRLSSLYEQEKDDEKYIDLCRKCVELYPESKYWEEKIKEIEQKAAKRAKKKQE